MIDTTLCYRRLHVMLRRDGHAVNRKRAHGHTTAARDAASRQPAMVTGLRLRSDDRRRRFRILTVIDNCGEYPALVADTSLSGRGGAQLDAIILRGDRAEPIQ